MSTPAATKITFRHYAVVAVFAFCMAVAQFSALQHSIHHPFHEHTHLCDSFLGFDHSSASLTHYISLYVPFIHHTLSHESKPQTAFHRESGSFRIRGPPSPLV
jgi:hypothetical protein